MVRKRRKLSKEYELQIENAKKHVELINAQINDIDDEDIQLDYSSAFRPIVDTLVSLVSHYDTTGVTDETTQQLHLYNRLIEQFGNEYEL